MNPYAGWNTWPTELACAGFFWGAIMLLSSCMGPEHCLMRSRVSGLSCSHRWRMCSSVTRGVKHAVRLFVGRRNTVERIVWKIEESCSACEFQ